MGNDPYLVLARGWAFDAEFEESKHPRGESGKFAKAATHHEERQAYHNEKEKERGEYANRHSEASWAHGRAAEQNWAAHYWKRTPRGLTREARERYAIAASRAAEAKSRFAEPSGKSEIARARQQLEALERNFRKGEWVNVETLKKEHKRLSDIIARHEGKTG